VSKTQTAHVTVHGLLHPGFGPLVRVRLARADGTSRSGIAILDTGASRSAIDKQVAVDLVLPTYAAATWHAVNAVDERPVSPMRRATLGILGTSYERELDLIEVPALTDHVSGYELLALLGWDFLERCKLSCDGPAGTFVLEVPQPGRAPRRRPQLAWR
jgi:hypothetical protein